MFLTAASIIIHINTVRANCKICDFSIFLHDIFEGMKIRKTFFQDYSNSCRIAGKKANREKVCRIEIYYFGNGYSSN